MIFRRAVENDAGLRCQLVMTPMARLLLRAPALMLNGQTGKTGHRHYIIYIYIYICRDSATAA